MLVRPITYVNFDGETVTKNFCFNMSKPELIEMEVEYPGGFAAHLEAIVKAEDQKKIIAEIKHMILMSYGTRDDEDTFMKSEEISNRFAHTAAYQHLFMELGTDANAAADFVMGVFPQDMVDQVGDQLRDHMAKALATIPPETPAEPDSTTT